MYFGRFKAMRKRNIRFKMRHIRWKPTEDEYEDEPEEEYEEPEVEEVNESQPAQTVEEQIEELKASTPESYNSVGSGMRKPPITSKLKKFISLRL